MVITDVVGLVVVGVVLSLYILMLMLMVWVSRD